MTDLFTYLSLFRRRDLEGMTVARGSFQHSSGEDLQVSPRKLFMSVERREKLL